MKSENSKISAERKSQHKIVFVILFVLSRVLNLLKAKCQQLFAAKTEKSVREKKVIQKM